MLRVLRDRTGRSTQFPDWQSTLRMNLHRSLSVAEILRRALQVLRTAQYGCNCRGQGGNGGCGEFDIVEAVIGNENSDMLFTTVYDFKGTGSPGQGKYFLRPSVRTRGRFSYRCLWYKALSFPLA